MAGDGWEVSGPEILRIGGRHESDGPALCWCQSGEEEQARDVFMYSFDVEMMVAAEMH